MSPRRADGVGVLALDGLDSVAHAGPVPGGGIRAPARVARRRARLARERRRRPGDADARARLADRPTADARADVLYKDRTRQWWTAGRPAEGALAPGTPVTALISRRTYSSGEALAYHLQSQRLARLVGERTPGAAGHVTPVVLTPHVRALLPEARVRDAVTGANWEGTSVVPDVACAAGTALELAAGLLTP
jgi:hypothetical protein